MPRAARQKCNSKIYHIMLRGINHQNIFEDEGDYYKFIEVLDKYHNDCEFDIYAYCLMGNHIHLLIKEGKEDFSNTMRRIGVSYVKWYNWQYNRVGHLFQNRYKSEVIDSESYFLTVIRYIHQNPVKAGLVSDLSLYKWSSYREYMHNTGTKLIKTDFVLNMFDNDKDKALQKFIRFNNDKADSECLELTKKRKTISDKDIKQVLWDKYNIELIMIQNQPKDTQIEILRYLKRINGSSFRQLSRLTGFTVNKIFRA